MESILSNHAELAAQDPLLGKQLANYRVERLLGSGGMARVYYGTDLTLHRPVALKIVDKRAAEEKKYADRFLSEARIVASWRHPNICQIFYANDEAGLLYYVMEFVDGMDLSALQAHYASEGVLIPYDDVLMVGKGVASALDYAHERGVIHRDVKPANIIINREGMVFLTDFGLATDLSRDSLENVFGTAHYIAPEQAKSATDVVRESDLYSLGVILYEMLTGVVPFDDPSPVAVAMKHVNQDPPLPRSINPELTPTTETVLLKALAKDPADRFESAAKLMEHLERGLTTENFDPTVFGTLPPLPPDPSNDNLNLNRTSLGSQSVSERLWERVSPSSEPVLQNQPNTRPRSWLTTLEETTSVRSRILWISLAVLGVLLIVIGSSFGVIYLRNRAADREAEFSSMTATALQVIAIIPTETLTPTITPTVTNSPTATVTPTHTPIPSPTILYPDGRRFLLYYDSTSFQVHNKSGVETAIEPISFERLGTNNQVLNVFKGREWSRYNPDIRDSRCMRIVIRDLESNFDPPLCQDGYEATRTAELGSTFVFWTEIEGSQEFRVLWEGAEIARCTVGAGVCEFFLPPR